MDEQRLEAYFYLIDALLTCPSGEEPEILDRGNQDLIDEELVQTMKQVAAERAEEDDQDAAEWLQHS